MISEFTRVHPVPGKLQDDFDFESCFYMFVLLFSTELLVKFLHAAKLLNLLGFGPRKYARSVSSEKCCRMH